MEYLKWVQRGIAVEILFLLIGIVAFTIKKEDQKTEAGGQLIEVSATGDYIKWVDFKVSYEALCRAYELDVTTHGEEKELHWIELLAHAGSGRVH